MQASNELINFVMENLLFQLPLNDAKAPAKLTQSGAYFYYINNLKQQKKHSKPIYTNWNLYRWEGGQGHNSN